MLRPHIITVVGGGVAGSAIAHALVRRRFDVQLLYRSAEEGASFTNQKWLHSGMLYPSETLLKQAWAAYQRSDPLIFRHFLQTHPARFLCLRGETIKQRRKWLEEWHVKDLGLDWHELAASELVPFPGAIGGFRGPDRVIDFPALIRQLRSEVKASGGVVVEGAYVTRLLFDRISRRVQGVGYRVDGSEHEIVSDHTILAAGAWSVDLIRHVPDIQLPRLLRKKCVVLSYPGEFIPGITVCLDVTKRDGSLGDTTLVPFHGRTLATGVDWRPVDDVDNARPTDEEVGDLKSELAQWFPTLNQTESLAYVCVKTEPDTAQGPPNVLPTICGPREHGAVGLTVVFPGKASFMFDLARSVVDALDGAA